MQEQTFIEFVVEMITNEDFQKQTPDHKAYVYARLEELYDMRMKSQYDLGHHHGWMDAVKKSIETIKEK